MSLSTEDTDRMGCRIPGDPHTRDGSLSLPRSCSWRFRPVFLPIPVRSLYIHIIFTHEISASSMHQRVRRELTCHLRQQRLRSRYGRGNTSCPQKPVLVSPESRGMSSWRMDTHDHLTEHLGGPEKGKSRSKTSAKNRVVTAAGG